MDTARYIVAVLVWIGLPPAIVHWLIIDPLVAFWRKRGKAVTFAVVASLGQVYEEYRERVPMFVPKGRQ